jgi:hypothetical protein
MADRRPHLDGNLFAEQHDTAVSGRLDGIARQCEIAGVFDEDENLTQVRPPHMGDDVTTVIDENFVSGVDGKRRGHGALCVQKRDRTPQKGKYS